MDIKLWATLNYPVITDENLILAGTPCEVLSWNQNDETGQTITVNAIRCVRKKKDQSSRTIDNMCQFDTTMDNLTFLTCSLSVIAELSNETWRAKN